MKQLFEALARLLSAIFGKPAPKPQSGQHPLLLKAYRLAQDEVGTKEIPGPQHNEEIVDWAADVGHAWVRDDETAWCASFVGAMLEKAGLRSTRKLNARSYMEWGQPTTKPQAGDLVIFWRKSPSHWTGHVGFFVKREGDRIMVLGGNQSNAVNTAWYPAGRLLGFRTVEAK